MEKEKCYFAIFENEKLIYEAEYHLDDFRNSLLYPLLKVLRMNLRGDVGAVYKRMPVKDFLKYIAPSASPIFSEITKELQKYGDARIWFGFGFSPRRLSKHLIKSKNDELLILAILLGLEELSVVLKRLLRERRYGRPYSI